MKIAIVHYWLITMRGGEKVLEELCHIYPQADIFTHVIEPARISETIRSHRITTSFIARLPGAVRHYQLYLPLMPLALEQLDLRGYDLVISSESGPAKGIITSEDALHICYCHSPMRYLWGMYQEYRESAGYLTRMLMAPAFSHLRQWDLSSAARVDHFVANSSTVRHRIAKTYRREADVIHPPVAVEEFSYAPAEDFYLFAGQLVPYKRAATAVDAFNRMGKPLVVAGEGSELFRLKRMAGPTVQIVGSQTPDNLRHLFATCKALIFPGEEDFGIVPVEAMAAGKPVIAYAKGGVRDTVIDGITGVLYPDPSANGIASAVLQFEQLSGHFDRVKIQNHAERFSSSRFRSSFKTLVETKLAEFRTHGPFAR